MIPGVGPKTHKSAQSKEASRPSAIFFSASELAARYLDLDRIAGAPASPRSLRRQRNDLGHSRSKTIAQMEKILWELVEEVGGRLRREELFARCLTVKIRYSDFQTLTRSRTLAFAHLFRQGNLCTSSATCCDKTSVAAEPCGCSASAPARCKATGWQEPLLGRDQRQSFEKLYKGIDELRRKYGEDAIGAATPRHRAG